MLSARWFARAQCRAQETDAPADFVAAVAELCDISAQIDNLMNQPDPAPAPPAPERPLGSAPWPISLARRPSTRVPSTSRLAPWRHYASDHRRVHIDAGTALEHLLKASLARRSPALVAELRGESSFRSIAALLGVTGTDPSAVRTVGLRAALDRAGQFLKSQADMNDLRTLADIRNGVVHAAGDTEVEERILAAFLEHSDAVLTDLNRDRADFWGGQLRVVDMLIQGASDKVAHRVGVRLEEAEAALERRISAEGNAVVDAVIALSGSVPLAADQRIRSCPVCGSAGVATGEYSVEWEPYDWNDDGQVSAVAGEVWFTAHSFRCPVCFLRLVSEAEVGKAFDAVWQIEGADWRKYEPVYEYDDDAAYERRRDDTRGL